jgi:hypothetical protein
LEEALLLPFDSQLECVRLDGPNNLAGPTIAHPLYEDKTTVVFHVIGYSFLACQIFRLAGSSNAIGGHGTIPPTMAEQARHCPPESYQAALQLGSSLFLCHLLTKLYDQQMNCFSLEHQEFKGKYLKDGGGRGKVWMKSRHTICAMVSIQRHSS